MVKKTAKAKAPKKVTVTKSVSVVDQIHVHHACIKKDEAKLPVLYDKALAQLEKQLDQKAKKTAKTKAKATAHSAKLKIAKDKLKAKKTAATKAAVDKLKLQFPMIKAELKVLSAELAEVKKNHGGMKLLHKKFVEQVKVLNAFERAWEKSLTKKAKKKPAKKKVAKKSVEKKAATTADKA
jgi:hypothetical protein